ncbi:MAG: sarcosine oxidase subunit gamma [Acidisphaera sp.]|nr:sarcosine oxidase subunit gamma [Acidisphaera sp.]
MAEAARRDALSLAAHTHATVTPLSACSRFVLRGRAPALAAAGAAFGVPLPREACRAAVVEERAALWLGPDEILLLAPEAERDAVAGALHAALTGLPHALVDVGHRSAALEVAGPGAAFLLNAACPLDLGTAAFPAGMCTRTVLGKCEILLWRVDAARFRLEAMRSYADYVWRLLEQARRDWTG